jgi:hypothetical protein
MRQYDCSGLAVGTSQQITVAERIDVSEFIDCMLVVRVHSVALAASNSMVVDVYGDGHSEEDSGLQFVTSSPLFTSQALSALTTPYMLSYGGTVRGEFVSVVLTATKVSASSCRATISVDLILRSPDEV